MVSAAVSIYLLVTRSPAGRAEDQTTLDLSIHRGAAALILRRSF